MAKNAAGSATDTAVKLVLIFFISLLSFSVGTYVGKKVSDSEHDQQALEGSDYQSFSNMAANKSESEEAKNDNTLTEEEVASLTEEFVKAEAKDIAKNSSDERTPASKDSNGYAKITHEKDAKASAAKKEEKPEDKAKMAEKASKESKRLAEGKAPTPDAKKKRKPASKLPSVASSAVGKYTVQVASYATEAEARDHAATLTEKGFSAFYIPAKVKTQTWYRVSVGLFANRKSAMSYRKTLMDQANVTSAIIQKIIK